MTERRKRDPLLIACATLGFLSAVIVGVFVVPTVLGTSAEQDQIARLAKRNESFGAAIQRQRVETILANCRSQNRRHDRTIATLDALLVKRVERAGLRERLRLRMRRASTVALIKALAPRRDCRVVVARAAPMPTPTPTALP